MKKAFILLLTLCTFVAVHAQIVGANTQQGSLVKPSKLVPEYRPTGGFLEIGVGRPYSFTVGKQLSSSLMIGGTFGYLTISDSYDWVRTSHAMPLLFTARIGTPKYNFSLFTEAKVGVDLYSLFEGYEFEYMPVGILTVGFAWRNIFVSGGISLYFNERRPYYGTYESGLRTSAAFSVSYRIPFETIKKVLL